MYAYASINLSSGPQLCQCVCLSVSMSVTLEIHEATLQQ